MEKFLWSEIKVSAQHQLAQPEITFSEAFRLATMILIKSRQVCAYSLQLLIKTASLNSLPSEYAIFLKSGEMAK